MNITNTTTPEPATLTEAFRSSVSTGVGIIGLISTCSSFSIILLIIRLRLYKQIHTRLVLYLCMSDFIQGLAAVSSLGWINHVPLQTDTLCIYQAIMFQIGDLASSVASFYIGLYVWLNIHFLQFPWIQNPGRKFERIVVVSIVGVSVSFCVIGQIKSSVIGIQIYDPVGFKAWCWIGDAFALERIVLHYLWIMVICFILFVLYINITITLNRTTLIDDSEFSNEEEKSKRKKLALKMIGFPIIFFCAFVPLCMDRVINFATKSTIKTPNGYVAFSICMFVCNGFLNAFLYGYSRKLFHKLAASKEAGSYSSK